MKAIKLDEKRLQEMAEQYAVQGAEKAIREFYTGYDSPFVKMVQKELAEKMEMDFFFSLPQLTAAINQAINDKVSEMANTMVAQTFLPMLNRMFTGERETVVTTQDLVDHFGAALEDDLYDDFDPELLELEVRRSPGMGTCEHVSLYFKYDDMVKFELSLMGGVSPKYNEKGEMLYEITSLPGCSQYRADSYPRERQMRLRLKEGAKLEMPFTPDVLRDEFMRFVASLMINNTMVVVKNCHEYRKYTDD